MLDAISCQAQQYDAQLYIRRMYEDTRYMMA